MPSEEQLQEFREAFALFDRQGKGLIDKRCLGDVLRAIGQNPTQAQVNTLVQSAPESISFDQFVNDYVMRDDGKAFQPQATLEQFVQGLQVFDKDGNGFISAGELRYVLTSLGEKLTDEEVDELLKSAEVDANGYVNYEQFVKTILSG